MSLESFDRQMADLAQSPAGHSFGQAQCWICPHCFDDSHHYSDAQGCEWHGQAEREVSRVLIGPTDV